MIATHYVYWLLFAFALDPFETDPPGIGQIQFSRIQHLDQMAAAGATGKTVDRVP